MAALGLAPRRGSSRSGHAKGASSTSSASTSSAMCNERWVMLNKDHFQRIFNDTLDEMTAGDWQEQAAIGQEEHHHDQDLPVDNARLTPDDTVLRASATPSPPSNPSVGLNLVIRESRGQHEDSAIIRGCGESGEKQTTNVDSDSKNEAEEGRPGPKPTLAAAGAPGESQATSSEKNLDTDKTDNKAGACAKKAKCRTWPEGGRSGESKVKAGAGGATNALTGSPLPAYPPPARAQQPARKGPVCSELLKNRPLVCAALFGEHSSGRQGTGAEGWPANAAAASVLSSSSSTQGSVHEERDPQGPTHPAHQGIPVPSPTPSLTRSPPSPQFRSLEGGPSDVIHDANRDIDSGDSSSSSMQQQATMSSCPPPLLPLSSELSAGPVPTDPTSNGASRARAKNAFIATADYGLQDKKASSVLECNDSTTTRRGRVAVAADGGSSSDSVESSQQQSGIEQAMNIVTATCERSNITRITHHNQQSGSKVAASSNSGKKSHGVGKSGHKRTGMKRAVKTPLPAAQPQRENWVTMNKSTLVNLVDVLVGSSGLSSSGDDDDEPRSPIATDLSKSSSMDQTDIVRTRTDKTVQKSRPVHRDYSTVMTPSGPLRSQLKTAQPPIAKSASTRKAPSVPEKPAKATANKQVLKQCWVALNKTVVFDMVELAMGGSPDHRNKDQPEGARYGDGDIDRASGGCDGDCSENSTDSMCSVHGPQHDQQSPPLSAASKTRTSRKRVFDSTDSEKLNFGIKKKGRRSDPRSHLSYRPEVRMLAPERPASAPVEASPIHPSLRSPGRAPSPHSKEYDILRRVHASECERLMSWAKRCARTQPQAPSASSTNTSQASENQAAPAAQGSRDSPKLGWVAVSKADVHTIMDNVMSTMILDPEDDEQQGQERENLSHSPSPSPPPPHLIRQVPSPPVSPRGPCLAPHRPWLDPEPPIPTSHSNSASSSSSNSSQASSPPPSHDGGSSPSDKGLGASRGFKWKSTLLQRCQGSPEHESHSDDDVSRKTPSPPEVAQFPGKSDSRKARRKRRHTKSK